jgi:hypothetical protein
MNPMIISIQIFAVQRLLRYLIAGLINIVKKESMGE